MARRLLPRKPDLTTVPDSLDKKIRDSQVWKAIFRPGSPFRRGYQDNPRNRAMVMVNNVMYHLHPV